jgi:hypothetical protein
LPAYLWFPPCSLIPYCVLFIQLLSWGSGDVLALLPKVTQMWEAATTTKVTRVMVVVATETFAQETAMVRDSFPLCVQDAEDRDALEERVALEKVSRAEVQNAMALASTHVHVKGFVRKIAPLRAILWRRVGSERSLRGSTESILRSSPFCRPRTLSCAMPLSVPHG